MQDSTFSKLEVVEDLHTVADRFFNLTREHVVLILHLDCICTFHLVFQCSDLATVAAFNPGIASTT